MSKSIKQYTTSVSEEPERIIYSWEKFLDSGLLWVLNTTVLHPRGLSMGVCFNEITGEVLGWSVFGKGDEVWVFEEETAEEGFVKFQNFLQNLQK